MSDRAWVISCLRRRSRRRFSFTSHADQRASMRRSRCGARSFYGQHCKRSDGRWRARYRDAAGVEHSRHFTRKVEAQYGLDTVTTAVTSGTYTDPRRSRITVSDWSARWLATKVDLKATT
jgi:hypothetical protein